MGAFESTIKPKINGGYLLFEKNKIFIIKDNGNIIREISNSNFLNENITFFMIENYHLSLIPKFLIEIITNLPKLKKIDFSQNLLTLIPKEIINIKTLKRLNFFLNKISFIKTNSEYLILVDLGWNEIEVFPIFKNQITNLCLDNNKILKINIGHLYINKLTLSLNKISEISEKIKFSYLQYLDLSKNNLKLLPNLKKIFPKLRKLDLSFNQIIKFPILPRTISYLYLQNNFLTEIDSNIEFYTCLSYLNISFNKIKLIPILPNSIKELFINDNQIDTIFPSNTPDLFNFISNKNNLSFFPGVQTHILTSYQLSFNNFINLNNIFFSNYITFLDLSFNFLTSISPFLFKLNNLFNLNLSFNRISIIPEEIFNSQLITLYLSGNPINNLPNLPFTLENLIISQCNINDLTLSFSNPNNLLKLIASGNQLNKIPNFSSCITLILSNNKFFEFPIFSNNIEYLDLSNNLLEIFPDNLILTQLQWADFSYNSIFNFPNTFIAPRLRSFYFQGNPATGQISLPYMPNIQQLSFTGPNLFIDLDYKNGQTIIEEISIFKFYNFFNFLGTDSYSDNSLIISPLINKNIYIFGIIDEKSLHHYSDFVCHKILNFFNKKNYNFNKKLFEESNIKLKKSLQKLNCFLTPSYSLICIKNNILHYFIYGESSILLISNDFQIQIYSYFINILDINSISPNKPIFNENQKFENWISDSLVYNFNLKLNIGQINLNKNHRWVILLSDLLLRSFSLTKISSIFLNDSDCTQIFYRLKNLFYSINSSNNFSLILIDLNYL